MNLISTTEAAQILKCTHQNVWRLIKRGELMAQRVGRNYVTTEEWINDMLRDRANRFCRDCGTRFDTGTNYRLFCSDECRVRYHSKMRAKNKIGAVEHNER